jgi:DNA-binding transcriptional MerR regulator
VAVYSISDLEKLSGIKAHTLRIWEQRYGIIEPKRTETNIRYYEDDDLKFIINVALLNRNGFKISKIARMTRQQIAEQVANLSEPSNAQDGSLLDALTLSMIDMDEYKFDRILNGSTRQIGFERTMLELVYPFLEKLSVLWLTGSINPVQENYISYLIRQKLIVAIDKAPLPAPNAGGKCFALYLPQGERQELSLLFMTYLLKVRGHNVLYLGQDISVTDLRDACNIRTPDYIFTMITETFARESVQHYIDRLAATCSDVHILLSGYQVVAQEVEPPANVTILKSLDHTMALLAQLDAERARIAGQPATVKSSSL